MGQLNRLLEMVVPESTSSNQEGVMKVSPSIPAAFPQTTELKQLPSKLVQPTLRTAQKPLTMLYSSLMPYLSYRLYSLEENELNDLFTALSSLCKRHQVTLQWIPSHCDVQGNEKADTLAKEGSTKEQVDRSTTLGETKTVIKAKQHSKWLQQHPQHNKKDPYHLLSR